MSRPVRLRIDELVLHGFDPRDRHAIGDAVRDKLTRLLSAGDASRQIDATIPNVRDVAAIAAGIARETHRVVQPHLTHRGRP
jgi:hypothetical protein